MNDSQDDNQNGNRTNYHGIEMEFPVHAKHAKILDILGAEWAYQPFELPALKGNWIPDFQVEGVFLQAVQTVFDAELFAVAGMALSRWHPGAMVQIFVYHDDNATLYEGHIPPVVDDEGNVLGRNNVVVWDYSRDANQPMNYETVAIFCLKCWAIDDIGHHCELDK